MKLKPMMVAALVLFIIFGGIMVSHALGLWKTASSKEPAKFQTGDFAGEADPSDIRGSYTLSDIAKAFPIEVEVLAEAFAVTDNPEDFQVKRLEDMYPSDGDWELGTASVRYFVARFTDLPYDRTGEEALFPRAVQMLKENGKISDQEASEIPMVQPGIQVQDRDQVSEPDHVEAVIKGNTSVADLLLLGLSQEEIIAEIGPYESKGDLVRDVCKANGIAFSTAKEVLTELVEQKK